MGNLILRWRTNKYRTQLCFVSCTICRRRKLLTKTNITKIKYVIIGDKLYEVKRISFYHMSLTAAVCDKSIEDVPVEEIFPLDELRADFKVKIETGQTVA